MCANTFTGTKEGSDKLKICTAAAEPCVDGPWRVWRVSCGDDVRLRHLTLLEARRFFFSPKQDLSICGVGHKVLKSTSIIERRDAEGAVVVREINKHFCQEVDCETRRRLASRTSVYVHGRGGPTGAAIYKLVRCKLA